MGYEKSCTTGTCLKKFLVHFRRSSNYKGEYGFDWVREDYIYKNLKINDSKNTNNPFESVGGIQQNGSVEICNEVNLLKKKYLAYPNVIKPYGYEYFASWCSLFSADISNKNSNGVNLSLQVEEIDKIINDGTIIEFEVTSKNIVISPKKIDVSKILTGSKVVIKKGNKSSNSYYLKNIVNIKCNKAINKIEQIRVFAKRNGNSVEVGKINIYKNSIIKKANIVVIPVSFENGSDTPVILPSLVDVIKNKSFNQAIIDVDVKIEKVMDVKKIINNIMLKNPMISSLIMTRYSYLWLNKGNISSAMYLDFLSKFYSTYVDKNAQIDKGNSGKKTFVFVTNRESFSGDKTNKLDGEATLDQSTNELKWGDLCVIYKNGSKNCYTYLHEIAHTLGLEHSFDNIKYSKSKLTFRRGYTDNTLDYLNTEVVKSDRSYELNKLAMLNNGCFFYWQWDAMRNDKSVY